MLPAHLSSLDLWALAVYVVGIAALGWWAGRRQRTAADYFLAGRTMGWVSIGLSMFATNISASSLVGMAGEAYGGVGIAVYNYEWTALLSIGVLVGVFLPLYLRSGFFTVPEFLERRYDRPARLYFSAWMVFLYITVDTAGTLFAGAVVVSKVLPDVPVAVSVGLLALLGGVFIVTGGFRAVVATGAVQAVLLLLGSAAVAYTGWMAVGSWEAVRTAVPPEALTFRLPPSHPVLPWPGIFTGMLVLGLYFWVTNQFMVQRALAARSLDDARWGVLFAALLKLPVFVLMVLPGTFARVLYPGLPQAEMALPTLVFDLLPEGLRALVLVGILAALMSSVESALNSAATLVTMDFGQTLWPRASSQQLARIGRIATAVFIVVAVLWTPFIVRSGTLWTYLQGTLAYAVPPFVTLFLGGVFWRRATARGARAALGVGHAASGVFFVLGPVLGWLTVPFLYVPMLVLLVSGAALVAVSLADAPPPRASVDGFTWDASLWRADTEALRAVPLWKNYRVQWALLTAAALVLFAWF